MDADKLKEVIESHRKWLNNEGGERADLRGADLSDADLIDAVLSGADLRGADLRDADLSGADLTDIRLTNAVGGNHRIQCLQIYPYKIIVLDNSIAWGGCTKKTVKEWLAYKGDDLNERDKYYLTKITKPFIRMCLAKAKVDNA